MAALRLLALAAWAAAPRVWASEPRVWAAAPVSPFNGRALPEASKPGAYRFLLIGHAYGAHSPSVFPSASLLANLDALNASGASFAVLLGDIAREATAPQFGVFERSFARKLRFPVFNAPGNHDVGDRALYEKRYGKAPFALRRAGELFLIVDSEIDDGEIRGAQRVFLLRELQAAEKDPGVRNVFLLSHRLLWAMKNPPYDFVASHANGPDVHENRGGYAPEILPLLRRLRAEGRGVFLAGGDVGAHWSLSLFYAEGEDGIHYVATGLGDTQRDMAVLVQVSSTGAVGLTPMSLTGFVPHVGGKPARTIADFGLEYWREHFAATKDDGR